MSEPEKGLAFKSVIMGYFYRLSETSAHSLPFNNILDAMWTMIEPFLDEYDKEEWRKKCTTYFSEEGFYQANINKIQLISLVLYKNGVFPNRDNIGNRKHKVYTSGGSKRVKGMSVHVIDDIKIQQFFMRHLFLMAYTTKLGMKIDVHLDVMWAVLSPYITEEDYESWILNNKKFGNKTSKQFNVYRWNAEKHKICMRVLERSDFLFETGITDEPDNVNRKANDSGDGVDYD